MGGKGRQEPLDVAVRALQHRDRSAADLDARLARAGVDEERRRETLDSLERLGYVDDGRFAQTRARSLADREYGDEAIRLDLEQHGVPAQTVEEALATLPPEGERVNVIVERRGGGVETARYLARKGFGEDAVEAAVAREP